MAHTTRPKLSPKRKTTEGRRIIIPSNLKETNNTLMNALPHGPLAARGVAGWKTVARFYYLMLQWEA
jgi:hypothetical protein